MYKGTGVPIFLACSIFLCLATGLLIVNGYREKLEAQGWVSHTDEVIQRSIATETRFKKAETNQRGYLLTGDPSFLSVF